MIEAMILRINKAHRIAIITACAEHGLSVQFFTDEKADGLCIAEIDTDNPAIAFYLGMKVMENFREEQEIKGMEDNLFDFFKISMP
jgi:hypothetical protein